MTPLESDAGAHPATTGPSRRNTGWLLPAAAVAGLALLASGAPLCPFAGWLGIPCPGCGLTRATVALVSGDWQTALRLHPLVGFVLPVLAWFAARALFGWKGRAQVGWKGRAQDAPAARRWARRLGNWCGLALAVALLAVWGLRFAGLFGGPVPVTTYAAWWHDQGPGGRVTR